MSAEHTFAMYWGSNPEAGDSPSTLSFATASEVNAYFQGIREADGFFGVDFVENPACYINKNGDVAERKGASTATKETERYVIWEAHPEPGTQAQVYAFETPAEAAAFQSGVTDMVGWPKYFLVPSEEFRPCASLEDAAAFLSGEAQERFRAFVALEDPNDDLIFVRADGAFVDTDWTMDQEILNEPAPAVAPEVAARERKPGL